MLLFDENRKIHEISTKVIVYDDEEIKRKIKLKYQIEIKIILLLKCLKI